MHHARHARPRGPAAGSDGAYISARARASRDRAAAARSLGRATGRTPRHAPAGATPNTQHGGQRRDASEFGDGASCVLCLQCPLPLTLTIQFWGGDHFGVITPPGSTAREG